MRFLAMVMLSGDGLARYEAGDMGNPEDYAAMGAYNEELVKAGVMGAGDGLHNSSQAARIEWGSGGPTVIDGPFTESKELLGRYWIFEAKSREEAVGWARKAPMQKGDVVVIRRIMEMDEFDDQLRESYERGSGHGS